MNVKHPSRAELFDAKRRVMADFLAASEALNRCDSETHAEDLAVLLDRREASLECIRDIDATLEDTASTDPASEIVAAAALQRTFEAAIHLDESLRVRIEAIKQRVAANLGHLQEGKKSLLGYRRDVERVSILLDKVA